jgi:type III pantothenate kinase
VANLIIDIGNSRTKVAIFQHDEMMISFPTSVFTPADLDLLLKEYGGIDKAILSTVRDGQEDLINKLKSEIPRFVELTDATLLPIKNNYLTPETLGKDRIAAVVGAHHLFPEKNILVIDAGTAIKYDFIDKTGVYQGGFITMGLTMRYKALNYFTDKLPLLEPVEPHDIDGNNTLNSIRGGVQYGLEGELERMIRYFTNKHGKFTLILTGGDAGYLEKIITSTEYVTLEITLLGLNTILEYTFSGKEEVSLK